MESLEYEYGDNVIDISYLYAEKLLVGPELDEAKLQLADQLLGDQKELVIQLCFDILMTAGFYREDGPGEGYAPVNVIKLLHHWRIKEVVPHLWVFIKTDIDASGDDEYVDSLVGNVATHLFRHWGPEIIDDLLQIAETADREYQPGLAASIVMNSRGHAHPRAYGWMKARFSDAEHEFELMCWSQCLLWMGGEDAIALVEERIMSDGYSDVLKNDVREFIEDFRTGRWQIYDDGAAAG